MKKILSLALVSMLCLALLTSCGGGVSGKYVSVDDESDYYDFQKDNKVEACKLGVILEGKYEIEEETVNVTFHMEALGAKIPVDHQLVINEDGSLTENILGQEFTYKKSK